MTFCVSGSLISKNPCIRLKHPGILDCSDGSDGSDGTLYPLTKNYTVLVVQGTGHIAHFPP